MIPTYALTAAALAAVTNGQIVVGEGAADVNDEAWNSVMESANLTSTQEFTGRDVSTAFPGKTQEGWKLHVALKDDVDAPNSDDKLTATTLSLSAPGDVKFDDSWNLCMHVFNVYPSSAGGWGSKFGSDCSDMVALECVDDMRKYGISKFTGDCASWTVTPSCLRDIEEAKGSSISIKAENAQDLIGENTSFYRNVAGVHPGNETEHPVLLEAAVSPRLVVSVWGPSGDSTEKPTVEVTCVMPNTVEKDSFDPAPPPPKSAASSVAAFAGWAALSGAVAFQFLS